MAEMRVTKKAWQRADRLKRAGLTSDALKEYREDIRIINESTLSGKAKNAAKEAAARKFLRNEESRVSVVKNPKPEPTIQKIRKEAQRREETQRPMDVLKKAWQRADRLKRAGIANDALAKYRRDMAKVNKSTLSRQQKRKLKEEIAEQFLKNVTSVKRGIFDSFYAVADHRALYALEKLDNNKKQKFMADYVDAAETSRAYLTARAIGLASSQVLNALDIIDADDKASVNREDSFVKIMNDTIDYVMKNEGVAPDDVTRFINNWTLKEEG